MLKVKDIDQKVTPAKKVIEIKDVLVDQLKFVDETGDITQDVLDAIPENVDKVSFKITVELLDEE